MNLSFFRKSLGVAALSGVAIISIAASPVLAQQMQQKRIEFSSGTGFFISRDGYLITNEHVIRSCNEGSITLAGAVSGKATMIGSDAAHDLALLKSNQQPTDSVTFLANLDSLQEGSAVLLLGYPLNSTSLRMATAKITGLKGPMGEDKWLQFTSAAQKGNSGGPLLDNAGNVVGVVTGKTQLLQVNPVTGRQAVVQNSDVAVSLGIIRGFLDQHRIRYRLSQSLARRMDQYLSDRAKHLTVNVKCVVSEQIL